MELLGMLHHLASWQFLALVAVMDMALILLHLTSPSPFRPILPTLRHHQPSSSHPEDDAHLLLLERVNRERERVGREMRERVREMRNLTRTLRWRGEALRSLQDSLGRLEDSIHRLQEAGTPTQEAAAAAAAASSSSSSDSLPLQQEGG